MMEQELISIVIPVHNSASFLEGCIESALKQTWENTQIILVDDGSEDASWQICRKYADKDPRILPIRTEDRGVSYARNQGLEAAKGSCITFLDADDRMHPKLLEALYGLLQRTGCEVAGCGFVGGSGYENWQSVFSESGGASEPVEVQGESGILKRACGEETEPVVYRAAEFIEKKLLYSDTRVWSKLFRREALKGRWFPEGIAIGEDMLFLLEVMLSSTATGMTGSNEPAEEKGFRIAETEKPYYFYYRNPNGAMERPFSVSYMDQLKCWQLAQEKIRQALPDTAGKTAARLAAIRCVSALLVTSKIARLSAKDRLLYREQWETARREAVLQRNVPGCREKLSKADERKLFLLAYLPSVYTALYRCMKAV